MDVAAVALGDLDHELRRTRTALERIRDEHLDWRPHAKSYTLGGLATHIANLPSRIVGIVQATDFDLAQAPPNLGGDADRAAVLERFDANARAARDAVAAADDAMLTATWTLRHGDRVLAKMPRAAAIRTHGLSHLIHHRAQLTVYLRLLDIPVPGLYGPSADERRD